MEWVKELIKKHTDKEGKFDREAFEAEYKNEFAKHAVIKSDFNSKVEELKTANETLEALKKDNKNVKELQTQIANYEKEVGKLQKEQLEVTKQHTVESALRDAGAKDVDYLRYKLGEVELNKDGSIKDLDNKIKALKESAVDFFEQTDKADDKNDPKAPGYKAVDNKLESGKSKVAYSFDQLDKLTPQEVNDNWDAVQAALEQGGNE